MNATNQTAVRAAVEFQEGDRVVYKGTWGNGPPRAGEIVGKGVMDYGYAEGEPVYDVCLDDTGEVKWGYSDQFRPGLPRVEAEDCYLDPKAQLRALEAAKSSAELHEAYWEQAAKIMTPGTTAHQGALMNMADARQRYDRATNALLALDP